MNRGWTASWLLALATLLATSLAFAGERLVFGSFFKADNARAFAQRLSQQLRTDVRAVPIPATGAGSSIEAYRVAALAATAAQNDALRQRARALGYRSWIWRSAPALADTGGPEPVTAPEPVPQIAQAPSAPSAEPGPAPAPAPAKVPTARTSASAYSRSEFDLGLQTRAYVERGQADQSRWHPSVSGQWDWFRTWGADRHSLTISPFLRIDGQDTERTHADLREGFYSYVGDRFEWHLGARQVFWGVTEFSHLVDIVNQTDLVENIDGEDKLGQGMMQLSLNRDWGVLDLYLLVGHRERTFPGTDGRLRFALPVATDDAQYESAAEASRVDGAVRWSHYAGPLSWGLHHFSGTSRDPLLQLAPNGVGTGLELVPLYQVIDQTGLDAQLLLGDWAWKLEAISRSGDGERYAAANVGFERTLVGVLGSRADLGVVLEYLWDERGDDAHSTLFERDLALGARWAINDAADSQALFGVIWDTDTDEVVWSIEASRQLGQAWQLVLEGRAFSGAPELSAEAQIAAFADGSAKSAFLQSDDFLQLEFKRFF